MDIGWSTQYGTHHQIYSDCFTDVKPIYSYRHGFISISIIVIIILFTTGYNATPGLL